MRLLTPRAAALALITLLGTAAILIHRLPRLADPLHSDEASFLLMAETQKSGGVIYRDQWSSHAPGLYLLLAALPEPLLRDEAAVRLVSVAALGAAVFFLAHLCLAAGIGAWGSAAGAAVFVLLNCNTWLQNQWLETEQLMAALLAAALWALVVRRNPGLCWLLLGVGLMFKQTFVLWLPFCAGLDWWIRDRSRSGSAGYWLTRAWVAAPAAAVAGYFLFRGAFADFVNATVYEALQRGRLSGTYANCTYWYLPLRVLVRTTSTAQTQTLLAGIGCSIAAALAVDRGAFLADPGRRILQYAGVILLGGIAFLKLQHCGAIYYTEMLYPAFFLLTAWAGDWGVKRAFGRNAPLGRIIGGGALLTTLIGIAVLSGTYHLRAPTDAWSQRLATDRDLGRMMPVRFPQHRIYTMSQPGLYWYSGQTPPKHPWSSDQLENFTDAEEKIHRDIINHGRGRRLLILFHRSRLSPEYADTLKFRDRLLAEGAVRFNDGAPLDVRLLSLYELYEWDLTRCGPLPARCPAGGG